MDELPETGTQILCAVCNPQAFTDPDQLVTFHAPCWERLRAAVGPMFLSTVLQKIRAGIS